MPALAREIALSIVQNPLVLLFALLSGAYWLDRVLNGQGRWYPLMVLAVAPLVGWLTGYELPGDIRTLGLVMFIYVVGLEAGVGFFPTFRHYWPRFLVIGLLASGLSACVAWCAATLAGLSVAEMVAFYAGAVSNSPAFEQMIRLVRDTPEVRRVFDLSSFVGVVTAVGAIVVAHTVWTRKTVGASCPVFFDADSPAESPYFTSTHRCGNTLAAGRTYLDVIAEGLQQSMAVRVRRGAELIDVTEETVCQPGDVVLLVSCSPRLASKARVVFGPAVTVDPGDPLSRNLPVRFGTVVVNASRFALKPVVLEDVKNDFGVEIRGWWRGPEFRPARKRIHLKQGDRLQVLGTEEKIGKFRRVVETEDVQRSEETDLLRFSVGVVVGLLLSGIAVPAGNPFGTAIALSVGVAGGPLLAGLLFGRSSAIRIPRGAGYFLKELGLGLFLAGVGTSAGKSGPIAPAELWVIPAVFAVVALPMLVAGLLLRRSGLGDQYIEGGVCGSVTSTAALIVSCKLTNTSEPANTYAGVYLFALLGSAAAAQVLLRTGLAG